MNGTYTDTDVAAGGSHRDDSGAGIALETLADAGADR